MALLFQSPGAAGLIQVSVDVELEQIPGVIGAPARVSRLRLPEPHFRQVQGIHKGINDANRVIVGDVIFNAGWEQQRLTSRSAFQMSHKK